MCTQPGSQTAISAWDAMEFGTRCYPDISSCTDYLVQVKMGLMHASGTRSWHCAGRLERASITTWKGRVSRVCRCHVYGLGLRLRVRALHTRLNSRPPSHAPPRNHHQLASMSPCIVQLWCAIFKWSAESVPIGPALANSLLQASGGLNRLAGLTTTAGTGKKRERVRSVTRGDAP